MLINQKLRGYLNKASKGMDWIAVIAWLIIIMTFSYACFMVISTFISMGYHALVIIMTILSTFGFLTSMMGWYIWKELIVIKHHLLEGPKHDKQ